MNKKFLTLAVSMIATLGVAAQDTSTETLGDKLYVEITQSARSKNWAQVAQLIEQVINANEDITDYEVTYAQALGELGRTNEGIQRLKAYLPNHSKDFQAYQVLGDLYADSQNIEKAEEAFNKCAELRPDFARPYVSLARMYGENNKEKAVENYNKAIRIFLQADRPDAAIQLGTEAMKLDNTNLQLLLMMGDALNNAGMYDRALALYAEVLTQAQGADDNSANIDAAVDANYNIAFILYKKGEYKQSLKFLERMYKSEALMKGDAKSYAMMLCLGAADKAKMGDSKGADKLLKKAAEFDESGYKAFYDSLLTINADKN